MRRQTNLANGGWQENGAPSAKRDSSGVVFDVNFSLNDKNNVRTILTADCNWFGESIAICYKFIAGNERFAGVVSQWQFFMGNDFALIPRQSANPFFDMQFSRFAGFVDPVPVVKTKRVV